MEGRENSQKFEAHNGPRGSKEIESEIAGAFASAFSPLPAGRLTHFFTQNVHANETATQTLAQCTSNEPNALAAAGAERLANFFEAITPWSSAREVSFFLTAPRAPRLCRSIVEMEFFVQSIHDIVLQLY